MPNLPYRTCAGRVRRAGALLMVAALLVSPFVRGEPSDTTDLAFLALLNEARAAAGQPPLIMVAALQSMARDWSAQQVRARRLSHRPIEHQSAWVEAHFTPEWRRLGENVGVGPSVESLHQTLMQSTKHRENALADFTHVGVGAVRDPSGQIWVTFNFVSVPAPSHLTTFAVDRLAPQVSLSTSLPNSSAPARSASATGALADRPTP